MKQGSYGTTANGVLYLVAIFALWVVAPLTRCFGSFSFHYRSHPFSTNNIGLRIALMKKFQYNTRLRTYVGVLLFSRQVIPILL
jgi:hypothetical protein